MKIDFSTGKETYKKNERLINLIAAFALVAQFISALVASIVSAKNSKGSKVFMIISAVGGAVGSYFLYKELIAPALSKKLAEYTLGGKDENNFDFDDYSDSTDEPEDLSWYEDDEEEYEEDNEEKKTDEE